MKKKVLKWLLFPVIAPYAVARLAVVGILNGIKKGRHDVKLWREDCLSYENRMKFHILGGVRNEETEG